MCVCADGKQSVLLLGAAGGGGRKPPVGMPMVLILWTRWATFPAALSFLCASSFGSLLVSFTSLDSFFTTYKNIRTYSRHESVTMKQTC